MLKFQVPPRKPLNFSRSNRAMTTEEGTNNTTLAMVKLKKRAEEEFGFAVRGGHEHRVGFYVSEVVEGSIAQVSGLKVGDEIVRVNGMSLEEVIMPDFVRLVRNRHSLVLRIQSSEKIPVQQEERREREDKGADWLPTKQFTSTDLHFINHKEMLGEGGERRGSPSSAQERLSHLIIPNQPSHPAPTPPLTDSPSPSRSSAGTSGQKLSRINSSGGSSNLSTGSSAGSSTGGSSQELREQLQNELQRKLQLRDLHKQPAPIFNHQLSPHTSTRTYDSVPSTAQRQPPPPLPRHYQTSSTLSQNTTRNESSAEGVRNKSLVSNGIPRRGSPLLPPSGISSSRGSSSPSDSNQSQSVASRGGSLLSGSNQSQSSTGMVGQLPENLVKRYDMSRGDQTPESRDQRSTVGIASNADSEKTMKSPSTPMLAKRLPALQAVESALKHVQENSDPRILRILLKTLCMRENGVLYLNVCDNGIGEEVLMIEGKSVVEASEKEIKNILRSLNNNTLTVIVAREDQQQ